MTNYAVDRNKWAKMTIFEQMGNIYSEVGRSFSANRRGDSEATEMAVTRAIDLFDATTDILVSSKSPRTKEVLRSKDQFLSVIYGNNASDEQAIDNYFLQYALVARNNR